MRFLIFVFAAGAILFVAGSALSDFSLYSTRGTAGAFVVLIGVAVIVHRGPVPWFCIVSALVWSFVGPLVLT